MRPPDEESLRFSLISDTSSSTSRAEQAEALAKVAAVAAVGAAADSTHVSSMLGIAMLLAATEQASETELAGDFSGWASIADRSEIVAIVVRTWCVDVSLFNEWTRLARLCCVVVFFHSLPTKWRAKYSASRNSSCKQTSVIMVRYQFKPKDKVFYIRNIIFEISTCQFFVLQPKVMM